MQFLPVLAALDADKNGEISAEEIDNAAAALKKLDKNGDGKLTEDELRPNFPGGRGGPAAVAPVRAVAAVKVADPAVKVADPAAKVVAPVDLLRKVAAVRAVGPADLLPKDAVKAVPVVKAANAPVGRSSSRE